MMINICAHWTCFTIWLSTIETNTGDVVFSFPYLKLLFNDVCYTVVSVIFEFGCA